MNETPSGPQDGHGAAASIRGPAGKTVQIPDPAALLAVVPHILGYRPADSLVVFGTEAPAGRINLTIRYDLPGQDDDAGVAREIARHATDVLADHELPAALAACYGPGRAAAPAVDALLARAAETGLEITEILRAENQRYWTYLSPCPPEGTPWSADHPAAHAIADSRPPVLASREELAASLAPATGNDARIMAEETRQAETDIQTLLSQAPEPQQQAAARQVLQAAGCTAVAEALGASQRGENIPAGPGTAWITVALRDPQVRNDAWARMDPGHGESNLRLWTALTRLARPGYVAAPASLLALAAWQSGNGLIANIALDRALDDDPQYQMAHRIREALDAGVPPELARIPMPWLSLSAGLENPPDERDL